MNFELVDVNKSSWTPPKELLKELKDAECEMFLYSKRTKLSFSIKRKTEDVSTGYDLVKLANAVRRYINARNETYILDFIPNHEQHGGIPIVREVGATCLINEVRNSLNGMVVNQIKSNEYELHLVNATSSAMAIMSGNITVKGSEKKEWHNNFAPGHIIGTLLPASELHISSIYMKPGRVFSNQIVSFSNGEMIRLTDSTHFMHNGLTEWRQPDMMNPSGKMKNPMKYAPRIINMEIPLQPYSDPHQILVRAMKQLSVDFKLLAEHEKKARDSFDEDEKNSAIKDYSFGNVNINVVDNDLTCITNGFDESVGVVIASNAKLIASETITHFTSHPIHPTKKEVVIRLSCDNVRDVFSQAIHLAIARVDSLIAQATK
jgi:hypothetical protein